MYIVGEVEFLIDGSTDGKAICSLNVRRTKPCRALDTKGVSTYPTVIACVQPL